MLLGKEEDGFRFGVTRPCDIQRNIGSGNTFKSIYR
jgi:hypothetical protein